MQKILIVDDDEDILRSTEMLVQVLGYEPLTTMDPGQVPEIAAKQQPALILQDLKMKGMNLAGLVASLRSNPATAEIPFVFFSASGDVAHMAAKHDAWGYLPKPFTEKELAQVLSQALKAPRARNPEAVRRDMESVFHDYWNVIAALNGYLQVLRRSTSLGALDRRAIDGLEESMLKLESKTDRLHSVLGAIITESSETEPAKAQ